jgi:hypothetical protein
MMENLELGYINNVVVPVAESMNRYSCEDDVTTTSSLSSSQVSYPNLQESDRSSCPTNMKSL